MDKRLLPILCCPVTHKGLYVAKAATLSRLNDAIAAGSVRNRDGNAITDPLKDALQTEDGKLVYPVRNGIPVLLDGEGIATESA